jgi:hypothetical protein
VNDEFNFQAINTLPYAIEAATINITILIALLFP